MRVNNFLTLIIFSIFFSSVYSVDKDQMAEYRNARNKFLASEAPKTWLLSYPRSGNTWVRYCIEIMTQRPTFDLIGGRKVLMIPLSFYIGKELDLNKDPVIKVHTSNELIRAGKANIIQDTLILIIRDPRYIFFHKYKKFPGEVEMCSRQTFSIQSYFAQIDLFDQWPENNRLMLYYENLVADPAGELSRLISFLGEDPSKVNSFMHKFDEHKNSSAYIYNTYGLKQKAAESKEAWFSVNKKEIIAFEQLMEKHYPYVWNMYLKKHYATQN